jgi:hypothetical protein
LPKELEWVWNARWASFRFADKEFFKFKESDFERRAAELSRAGANAVITFHGFHLIWSFVQEWDRLLEMLKQICSSCHAHGMRVVEHHSGNHLHSPIGREEWSHMLLDKGIGQYPKASKQMQCGDLIYKSVRLSSMYQIDPRTGQFARSYYGGWVFCHNNPDYQRLYCDHVRNICGCGVDGIMSDDIGFYPADYGCGCIHCRDKFQRDTGLDMPPAGLDDRDFYGNLENRAYRAWVLWRIGCFREHEERLADSYRSLGLKLARPMYSSSNTNSFATRGIGTDLDILKGLCTSIFTEVNSIEPQAHCWLRISVESKQRNALAQRAGVPSMCLFYPHNKEENLFTWGITKTAGQRFWGSPNWASEGDKTDLSTQTFNFESAHPQLYDRPEAISEVGVLFSARTVWLHKDNDREPDYMVMSDPASTDCWAGWCEMLTLANIPFDVITADDLAERNYFDRVRLIIVANGVCLSDKQIESLKEFARRGGRVIITHQSGLKDETGAMRKRYPLSDMVGAEYMGTLGKSPAWLTTEESALGVAQCNLTEAPVARFKPHKSAVVWMRLEGSSAPALLYHKYGKGSVITFAGKPGRIVCVNRHKRFEKNGKRYARIDFKRDKNVMALMEQATRYLLQPDLQIETEGLPRGFVTGLFGHGNHTVIHMINAAGTLLDSGRVVPRPAPLHFPRADELPGGSKKMVLKIRRKGEKATLFSPEFSGIRDLPCCRDGEYAVIEVSADLLRCYGAIELT